MTPKQQIIERCKEVINLLAQFESDEAEALKIESDLRRFITSINAGSRTTTMDFIRSRSKHWHDETFRTMWCGWTQHVSSWKRLSQFAEEQQLYELERESTDDAIAIVRFSLEKNAQNLIRNGDHRRKSPGQSPIEL